MKPRKWTQEQLKEAIPGSRSVREVLRKIGLVPIGGNYLTIKRHLKNLKLDTAHFRGQAWNRGLKVTTNPGKPLEAILKEGVFYKSFELKLRLFAAGLKPQYCEQCGWAQKTADGHLPLEIHHINGDPTDNRLENLEILCPNCHAMRPNYRARNRRQEV